jgi:hypothetical protein
MTLLVTPPSGVTKGPQVRDCQNFRSHRPTDALARTDKVIEHSASFRCTAEVGRCRGIADIDQTYRLDLRYALRSIYPDRQIAIPAMRKLPVVLLCRRPSRLLRRANQVH